MLSRKIAYQHAQNGTCATLRLRIANIMLFVQRMNFCLLLLLKEVYLLRLTANDVAKGRFLHDERPPFTGQKTAFRNAADYQRVTDSLQTRLVRAVQTHRLDGSCGLFGRPGRCLMNVLACRATGLDDVAELENKGELLSIG